MENNLITKGKELRRMINRHSSLTHRLPCETLAMVASHLGNGTSLITATRVCHFWRTALLSSPRLWSNLTFVYEKRALAFLERSKSAPLRIDLTGVRTPSEAVQESLRKIGPRVATLRGIHSPSVGGILDGVMDQSAPVLEVLDLSKGGLEWGIPKRSLPSLRTLIIHGPASVPFCVPYLTAFHFTANDIELSQSIVTNSIVRFLQGCPLLEDVYVRYSDHESPRQDLVTGGDLVSIPHLRSFTHVSSFEVELGLFNQLSFPIACQVKFGIRGPYCRFPPFLTLQDLFSLSKTMHAKIMARFRNPKPRCGVPRVVNPRRLGISLEVGSNRSGYLCEDTIHRFLGVFKHVEFSSVETLCLGNFGALGSPTQELGPEGCSNITQALRNFHRLKTLILAESNYILFDADLARCLSIDTLVVYSSQVKIFLVERGPEVDIINRVGDIAVARQKAGTPIRTFTLVFGDDEKVLRGRQRDIERLKRYSRRVQVVSGADTSSWDVGKYFLDSDDHPQG